MTKQIPPKSLIGSPGGSVTKGWHRVGLALLPVLVLSACATQQAVDEQTQPLKERFARTEQTLQALDAAAQARDLAMLAQIEQLTLEIKTLRQQLAEATASLLKTDAMARNEVSAANDRIDALGRRLTEVSAELQAVVAQVADQGERVTQAELRLDEMATSLPDRLAQAETRLETLTAAAAQTAERLNQSDQKHRTTAASLGDRLAKTEARLEAVAAGARGLAQEVAGEVSQQVAAPIAAKAAGDMAEQVRRELGGEIARQVDGKATEQAAALQALAAAEKSARDSLDERLVKNERRLEEITGLIDKALELVRHNEIMTHGKVVHTVTLTGDKTLYPLNLPDIHPEDQAKLTELVAYLGRIEKETHRKDYHLEIQGHTENIGMDDYTYQLAKARAEAVKRYLREAGGISLNHMSVISYGATQPIDPRGNNNRRIAILVRVLDR